MVESKQANKAEVVQPRTFRLEYDHGTFYQDDESLSHSSIEITALSPEEAALKGIRKLFGVEFIGEMTRFNPSTARLNISKDQRAGNDGDWVDPFSLVPNWQEVVKFTPMGHRLGLEPYEDFERRLTEFSTRQLKPAFLLV